MRAPHLVDLYHYNVGWCEEPACYVAACAEFQGLTTQDADADRALALLKTYVLDIIDGLREAGEPIPEPMVAPDFVDCT